MERAFEADLFRRSKHPYTSSLNHAFLFPIHCFSQFLRFRLHPFREQEVNRI